MIGRQANGLAVALAAVAIVSAACGAGEPVATTAGPPATDAAEAAVSGFEATVVAEADGVVVNGADVAPGEPIAVGIDDRIVLGEGARGMLRLGDDMEFELFKGTDLRLTSMDRLEVVAFLEGGHLRFALGDESEARLRLETPTAVLTTMRRGTEFSFCQAETGVHCAAATKGEVEVESSGETRRYAADQSGYVVTEFAQRADPPGPAICVPEDEFMQWFDGARRNEDPRPLAALVGEYPECFPEATTGTEATTPPTTVAGQVAAPVALRASAIATGDEPWLPAIADGRAWVPNRGGDGTLSLIDLETGETVRTYDVGRDPRTPVLAGGIVWAPSRQGDVVVAIDEASGEIVEVIDVGDGPFTGVATDDAVWFPLFDEGALARIDLDDREVQRIPVGAKPFPPMVSGAGIWVPNTDDGTVSRVSLETREVTTTVEVGAGVRTPVFTSGGRIWVAAADEGIVAAIDAGGDAVAETREVGTMPLQPLWAFNALWVPDFQGDTVYRVDTAGTTPIAVGAGPDTPVALDGYVWVPNRGDGTITRIDPATNQAEPVQTPLEATTGLSDLLVADGAIWAADVGGDRLVRFDIEG